jgi:subtilisin family serine protease
MKKLIISITFIFFIVSNPDNSILARNNANRYITHHKDKIFSQDEILVKFKEGVSSRIKAHTHLQLGTSPIRSFPTLRVQHLRLPSTVSVEDALRLYRQNPDVEYAEPNYVIYSCQLFPNDPPFDPDDPHYGTLWGLHNFGQTVGIKSGLPGADINTPDAWEISTGGEEFVIAVIDSGVAYSHPDLTSNMWTNPGEDPWSHPNDPSAGNGIDDDGNGKVDDWRGWDFVDGNNDPMDYNGHGTHVAGTIAAMGNNGGGVTGVMWRARMMPLRFLNADGIGWVSDAIYAIEYAVEQGVRVINASWGTTSFSQSLLGSIQLCQDKGVFVVAAAGNSAANTDSNPFYPASYNLPNIISVAATDQRDNLAPFSNWGPSTVDVAAPGVTIYSTWPPSRHSIGGSFPDDVESGAGDWETGGTFQWAIVDREYQTPIHCWTDSPLGDYDNNADSWLILPRIDLSRKWLSRLTYYLRMETEAYKDFLYIEASTDGANWTNISETGHTGSRWGIFSNDISAYDDQPTVYIRFRLVTDSQNTADGVYIDDVDIISVSHIYDGDEFQFLQGTSMAAPHVTGTVGLILAQYPTLSLEDLRWRILNGTDVLPSLTGKVAAGGRINANNSLRLPMTPSDLSTVQVSETEIELNWVDTSADEEGFAIQRREKDEAFQEIARVGPDTTRYSDTDITGESSYTYRVIAYNEYGNSDHSNEARTVQPGGDISPAGGGSGGGCFIATVAYGSPYGDNIDLLRAFRDEYLMAHSIGKKCITLYYRYSPPMAGLIADYPAMRKGVRIVLYPFVILSAATATSSIPAIILILTASLGLFSVGMVTHRRKSRP